MPPTDKGKKFKQLKIEEKAKILAWYENRLSSRRLLPAWAETSPFFGQVFQNSKRLESGAAPGRKKGSGRPKKVTKTHLEMIRRQILKYPSMTSSDLRQTVPKLASLSDRTIQRSLQKHLNMLSRCAAQKQLLTEKMKKKRIAFCKAYKDWPPKQWEKVMYSDESTFRCIRSTTYKVQRPSGSNRYDSRLTVTTVKHPDQVMVWGCFSGAVGRGGLFFLPKNTTMNGEMYQTVLENHLLPFMKIHG
jgi:hypothetical protein